jgi:hypothetical protein
MLCPLAALGGQTLYDKDVERELEHKVPEQRGDALFSGSP